MPHFSEPVDSLMTSPVASVSSNTLLSDAHRELVTKHITALAVVDGNTLVGVITQTDLLRVGRRQSGLMRESQSLTLPSQPVSLHMTKNAVCVRAHESLAHAAKTMLEHRIHRVFVSDGEGGVRGVLSTYDLMIAVRDVRVNKPVMDFSSAPVFTIRVEEPIASAMERLDKAHFSGIVVVGEQGWPVGIFAKREALAARELPRDTRVDEAMSSSLLVLPPDMPVFRAAHQAHSMNVRRVVTANEKGLLGIMTGLDFARVVAGA